MGTAAAAADRDLNLLAARSREFSEDVRGQLIAAEFIRPPDGRPSVPHIHLSKNTAIPAIDLARLDQDRGQIVEEVGRACREWGVFHIVNHGGAKDVFRNLEVTFVDSRILISSADDQLQQLCTAVVGFKLDRD